MMGTFDEIVLSTDAKLRGMEGRTDESGSVDEKRSR